MAAVLCICACSADGSRAPTVGSPPPEQNAIADASGRYQLRFAGIPVGATDLSVRRVGAGYRFRRDDRLSVRRDGDRVDSVTSIIVETDASLQARGVSVRSHVGTLEHASSASRDEGGWVIQTRHGQVLRRPGIEVAELALWKPQPGRAREPMLLAGASFALLEVEASRTGENAFAIDLVSDVGRGRLEVEIGEDGLPTRWDSDSGESATRTDGVTPAMMAAELLDIAAMPSRGRATTSLLVEGATRRPPPSVAGQRVSGSDDSWRIQFARPGAAIPPNLESLVTSVDQRIEDDLSLPGLGGADALRMGRGDCSGHASALALLASQIGYEVKLASGYRRRGARWLRHRWTIVKLEDEWVSMDPSFGEARPGTSRLMILAVHEATTEAMALADLLAFAGMTGASATFQ